MTTWQERKERLRCDGWKKSRSRSRWLTGVRSQRQSWKRENHVDNRMYWMCGKQVQEWLIVTGRYCGLGGTFYALKGQECNGWQFILVPVFFLVFFFFLQGARKEKEWQMSGKVPFCLKWYIVIHCYHQAKRKKIYCTFNVLPESLRFLYSVRFQNKHRLLVERDEWKMRVPHIKDVKMIVDKNRS